VSSRRVGGVGEWGGAPCWADNLHCGLKHCVCRCQQHASHARSESALRLLVTGRSATLEGGVRLVYPIVYTLRHPSSALRLRLARLSHNRRRQQTLDLWSGFTADGCALDNTPRSVALLSTVAASVWQSNPRAELSQGDISAPVR
jgi:hypothetical protein